MVHALYFSEITILVDAAVHFEHVQIIRRDVLTEIRKEI
jgi:hypothetical protein